VIAYVGRSKWSHKKAEGLKFFVNPQSPPSTLLSMSIIVANTTGRELDATSDAIDEGQGLQFIACQVLRTDLVFQ
jgi:hypothetical protein